MRLIDLSGSQSYARELVASIPYIVYSDQILTYYTSKKHTRPHQQAPAGSGFIIAAAVLRPSITQQERRRVDLIRP